MAYAKSETTITGILSAAERLFLAKNYSDVSMDDIAAAAGVTKGALYHHFETKEALYVAMMQAFFKEYEELYDAEMQSAGACRELVRRTALFFFHLPPPKREMFKLVRRDINNFKNPVRNQLIRAYQAALPERLEAILRKGICDGDLIQADSRLLAWLQVAMVEVILTRYAQNLFKNPNEIADSITTLFFDGIGKRRKKKLPQRNHKNSSVRFKKNSRANAMRR